MGGMYEMFQNDQAAERDGIWLDYSVFQVRAARAGGSNQKFKRLFNERTRSLKRAIDAEIIDDDTSDTITRDVYAEAIITDWRVRVNDRGEIDPNGKEWKEHTIEGPAGEFLPFNRDNVLATFERLPDLFRDIFGQVTRGEMFRAALRQRAAENLSPASSTTSTSEG